MRGQETDHVISGPMRGLTLLLFQSIMAKWGEGDPRWIVEERPDATNVNNWHWTERNADKWSKEKIKVVPLQTRRGTGVGPVNNRPSTD